MVDTVGRGMARVCISKDHPALNVLDDRIDHGCSKYEDCHPHMDMYAGARDAKTTQKGLKTSKKGYPEVMRVRGQVERMAAQQVGSIVVPTCKTSECFATYLSEWLPLQACTLRGVEFPCPSNSKDVLTRVYGSNWVLPEVESTEDPQEWRQSTLHKKIQANGGTLKVELPECIVSQWEATRKCICHNGRGHRDASRFVIEQSIKASRGPQHKPCPALHGKVPCKAACDKPTPAPTLASFEVDPAQVVVDSDFVDEHKL